MRHYFVSREHSNDEYFKFRARFNDLDFEFKSCSDVFSKDELDYGSLVLVKSVLEHSEIFTGDIMDMCCGYGTIAILLSKYINANWYLSDINKTAVELAKFNAKHNNCSILIDQILQGNMFEGVERNFDHIVSNPPIKAGKKYLLDFVDGAYSHLNNNGTLTLVIKKNLGADSLKSYLINLFGNCEIWERDKGYYILHSEKKDT